MFVIQNLDSLLSSVVTNNYSFIDSALCLTSFYFWSNGLDLISQIRKRTVFPFPFENSQLDYDSQLLYWIYSCHGLDDLSVPILQEIIAEERSLGIVLESSLEQFWADETNNWEWYLQLLLLAQ